MANIFGGNSNLPPGCRVNDIPGNRPEDAEWEEITNKFWDGKHVTDKVWHKFTVAKLDDDLLDVVDKAIEYGMELGRNENTPYRKILEHQQEILIKALEVCREQLKYLDEKFPKTGTTMQTLAIINHALNSVKEDE